MLFEELDPRHGLWDEDGDSGESEEEEALESDWAEDRGWLQEEPRVGHGLPYLCNKSTRPLPCRRQLFSPCRPWPHDPAPGQGSLPCWAGHLSGAGLNREPTGTDLGAHPAALSRLAPNPTVSANPAAYESSWEPGTGHSLSTRTLSHPSFYPYYVALSRSTPGTHPVPHGDRPQGSGLQGGPAIESGLLLPISSSEFFYTDPLMPPGHRVYNYLARPSQQVCQSLRLSTPDPIMSVREASPPPCPLPPSGMKWLSQAEYNAVSALLELPYEEPACSPGEGSPGTQLLLSAVEPEYDRVLTQEAANALLSLHSSPDTLGELLRGTEPPALPHGLGSGMLGAFFPHGAAGEAAL
ncbi:histone deacetylase complex subunit SAP25 [Mauremys mutica]|uniref:histone deacetylase complex subunit SAP25 n=1 Tax=Mauremys mutica TaxID=74926 RepID=UPI001D16567C|nr:histone deacetylase complex subunit SAP25 [Mauremys mutica]